MDTQPTPSDEQLTRNFEIKKHAHERWWHEYELINQRTTWLLTTQGVVGTAYGFILYRIAEVKYGVGDVPAHGPGAFIDSLSMLSDFLSAIGMGSSIMSAIGIYAACAAQKALKRKCGDYLGVTPKTTRMGQTVAVSTPGLCIAAWIFATIYFRHW